MWQIQLETTSRRITKLSNISKLYLSPLHHIILIIKNVTDGIDKEIWYDFWLPVYNELYRHYLNSYFTKLEAQAAIDYLKCNISPGVDCDLAECIKSTKSVTAGEIS